jgi:hypothetical protein
MSANVYAPLPGLHYIRLLTLGSSLDDHHAITANLRADPLDDCITPYCPLSYSWGMNFDGDASLTHEIAIDGYGTPVTENLFDGLIELRRHKEELSNVFWIDVLCINQADNLERTSQVFNMGQAYARGSKTAV